MIAFIKRHFRKIKWEIFKRILDVLQAVAVIGGIIIGLFTLQDTRKIESAKFVREINHDLDSKKYSDITDAIVGSDDDPPQKCTVPILKKSEGKISSRDLEDYIDNYEEVGVLYEDGLIDKYMAYNEFYYILEKVWCNRDIHKYILDMRGTLHSPDLYIGIQWLAERFLKEDNYLKVGNYEGSCAPLDNQ